jgi:WD40 repeat protein
MVPPLSAPHGLPVERLLRAPLTAASVSADGRLVLLGSARGDLALWDVKRGTLVRRLTGLLDPVTAVCLSTSGDRALSACGDSLWHRWIDLSTRHQHHKSGESGAQTLRMWDTIRGKETCTFWACGWFNAPIGHADLVLAVCLSQDGRRAVSASRDRTLRRWSTGSGRCLGTLHGHTGPVHAVCLTADGATALSASADHTLRLWDLHKNHPRAVLEGHQGAVTAVGLSADGQLALSGSLDGTLRLWSVAEGHLLHTVGDIHEPVVGACLSEDARFALSRHAGGAVRWHDVASGACLREFDTPPDSFDGVCLNSSGTVAMTAGADGGLWLWNPHRDLPA